MSTVQVRVKSGYVMFSRIFSVNFRKKMSFCEVHVHFDCADLHKARGWLCSVPQVSFYRRAALIF